MGLSDTLHLVLFLKLSFVPIYILLYLYPGDGEYGL